MARRIVIVVAWGLAGVAIAGGLIAGAFALAGEDLGQPATPPPPSASATKGPDGDDHARSPEAERTETRTTAPGDDHGGGDNEPGDDHGGGTEAGDDHGGSSNSGSGSDDSGSDSSNSGSGSSSSGSGSDDHGDD